MSDPSDHRVPASARAVASRWWRLLFIGVMAVALGVFSEVQPPPKEPEFTFTQSLVFPSPFTDLVARRRAIRLDTEALRARLPAWLALTGDEPPLDASCARMTCGVTPTPGTAILERIAVPGFDSQICTFENPQVRHWAKVLYPRDREAIRRIDLFQHGHDGIEEFLAMMEGPIRAALDAGHLVVLPLQPHMRDDREENQAHKQLTLAGYMLMGLRVVEEQMVISGLLARYPGARITFVGHSGGAIVGFYTSALDPRVDALAWDFFSQLGPLLYVPEHCEHVPNLYLLFDEQGQPRTDVLRARVQHVQDYGFPDQRALAEWIVAVTKE